MTREDIEYLAGVSSLLLIGAACGYLIGKIALPRGWSGSKLRLAAPFRS